ncbi:hypothetical protein [Maribacter aestuarii]|uniref:hypothetical protein n=1 Tax=Maribacter aestuarii TaxID=1130723 RepID=UPI00248CDC84|nr:hypothetical protein [Maribacter aestuarii]
MGLILKNKNLELQIDFPHENYSFSRFDWTGKIVSLKFKDFQFASIEDPNAKNQNLFGKGFYNEFGIDTALGFDETTIGGWFHKIGVGLLKKEDALYAFSKPYKTKPAEFKTSTSANQILISCISTLVSGYAYELRKEIRLQETGFTINYSLKNTGEKTIITDEYVHNFMALNNYHIGKNYRLNFPFALKPKLFRETLNTESAVCISKKGVIFNCSPNEQFFFSNLSGGKNVPAAWELLHLKTKIGIREKSSFQTSKINLWGWKHVISPELFFEIRIEPNETKEWARTYEVFEI